jgi:glutaminase
VIVSRYLPQRTRAERLATAAFSPRLDGAGNSVRGQPAIGQVVKQLSLGLYQA